MSNYCVARHYATKGNNDVELEMLLHSVRTSQLCMGGRDAEQRDDYICCIPFCRCVVFLSASGRSLSKMENMYYNVMYNHVEYPPFFCETCVIVSLRNTCGVRALTKLRLISI